MHTRNALNPANCLAKSSPRDIANWIASMLTQLDKFSDTETWIHHAPEHMDVDHTDAAGRNGPAENAGTHTEGAA